MHLGCLIKRLNSGGSVLYTSVAGKRMKKCSTNGWDREKRQPTGCTYIEWLKPEMDTGEPPPEEE